MVAVAVAPRGALLPSILPDATLVGSSFQEHTTTTLGSPIVRTYL